MTNDMDNVQQSLQQTMSQVINSLLTLIGVIAMMLTVSWQLTLVTLCIVPLSLAVSIPIGKAAQKRFVGMWKSTGELNAKVEESYTGHALVKVFGRRREVEASFHDTNEEMYKASFGAQFISALIMPANFFIGNLNFVAIAVLGGLRVASGTMQLGDVTAFIQYSRTVSYTHLATTRAAHHLPIRRSPPTSRCARSSNRPTSRRRLPSNAPCPPSPTSSRSTWPPPRASCAR